MSSTKYVKFQSQQNGDFTQTNNRVDFIIPASTGKVSLRDSFVQVYCNPQSTSNGVAKLQVAYKNNAGNASNVKIENVAMVKNATVSSANLGMIQSVRRADILKHNLDKFRMNPQNVLGAKYLDCNNGEDRYNSQTETIFTLINKEGDILSAYNQNVPIMVRLADVLPWGEMDVVDCAKTGDMRVSLEINFGNLTCEQVKDTILNGMDEIPNIAADPANPQNIDTLVITGASLDINDSPYFVNQLINISGTIVGGANPGAKTFTERIKSIARNPATGVITLTLVAPFELKATEAFNTITLAEADAQNLSLQFPLCELVVKELDQATPAPEAVMLTKIDTYELNANNNDTYNTTLDIHGNTDAVMIMPLSAVNVDLPIDALFPMNSFRLAVNNIDVVDNRSVELFTPLYWDRLVASMKAVDYSTKSLLSTQMVTDTIDGFEPNKKKVYVMASPTYRTGERKNLQIELNAGAGINKFVVFAIRQDVFEM